jgi:hypothetical protein
MEREAVIPLASSPLLLARPAGVCDEPVSTETPNGTRPARDAAALLLLALAVNLFRLGSKSFGLDESGSALYARWRPGRLFHEITASDPNMGLYYVMLHLWVKVGGESEAALRFPSAVFGALAEAALYLLGRRLFGRAAGLLAALLLALNPFMVGYAQTARAPILCSSCSSRCPPSPSRARSSGRRGRTGSPTRSPACSPSTRTTSRSTFSRRTRSPLRRCGPGPCWCASGGRRLRRSSPAQPRR